MVTKDVLKSYEAASGQKVNFDKTEISFSRGVHEVTKVVCAEMVGTDGGQIWIIFRSAKYYW